MMWPEPELRAIIRPEPEMKNRSLHSTSLPISSQFNSWSVVIAVKIIIYYLQRMPFLRTFLLADLLSTGACTSLFICVLVDACAL